MTRNKIRFTYTGKYFFFKKYFFSKFLQPNGRYFVNHLHIAGFYLNFYNNEFSTYHWAFSGLVQLREDKSNSWPVGHFRSEGLYSLQSQNRLQSNALGYNPLGCGHRNVASVKNENDFRTKKKYISCIIMQVYIISFYDFIRYFKIFSWNVLFQNKKLYFMYYYASVRNSIILWIY